MRLAFSMFFTPNRDTLRLNMRLAFSMFFAPNRDTLRLNKRLAFSMFFTPNRDTLRLNMLVECRSETVRLGEAARHDAPSLRT